MSNFSLSATLALSLSLSLTLFLRKALKLFWPFCRHHIRRYLYSSSNHILILLITFSHHHHHHHQEVTLVFSVFFDHTNILFYTPIKLKQQQQQQINKNHENDVRWFRCGRYHFPILRSLWQTCSPSVRICSFHSFFLIIIIIIIIYQKDYFSFIKFINECKDLENLSYLYSDFGT